MSAPSFSSFTPSFSSFPDVDAGQSSSKEKEKVREGRRKEKRDRGGGHKRRERDERHLENEGGKKHEHDRKSRRSRSRDEDRAARRRRKDQPTYAEGHISIPEVERSRSFYEDRKGDPLNVAYGNLHSGDIPRYRPISRKSAHLTLHFS